MASSIGTGHSFRVPVNATEYCRLVESVLGWEPPVGPPHRRYQAMASRVTRRMQETGYTFEHLALGVALCWREKLPRNPLGVFKVVPRACEKAVQPEADIESQVRDAIAYEQLRGDPEGWAVRLTRAQGIYRQHALDDWREAAR